jgi:hypothetical protein
MSEREEVVWRPRPSKHQRRYTDIHGFPYVVRYGNTRLTMPIFRRTFIGARLAAWWMRMPVHSVGRNGGYPAHTIFIERRSEWQGA